MRIWTLWYRIQQCIINAIIHINFCPFHLGCFFSSSMSRSIGKDPQQPLALNGDYPKQAIIFKQKCCCKWWPRMCLGLDVVNFIIFISKIAQNSFKIPKNHIFSYFLFSQKKFPKNNACHPIINWWMTSFFSFHID
jgi:hypothetical protein